MVERLWMVHYPSQKPPRLQGARVEGRAETNGLIIHLPAQAQYVGALLHEVAHIFELYEGRSGDHGPDFMKTVIRLYDTHLPVSEREMRATARSMGIEVSA